MSTFNHPALAIFDKAIDQENAVEVHLHNTGIAMPGSAAIYRAATWAGADAETAWEVTRRHYALCLQRQLRRIRAETDGKSDVYALTNKAHQYRERIAAVEADMRVALELPNPFAAPVALERAA